MLKEQFLGKYPSHFQVNPIVKAFITSEAFIWSAWNFTIPIFAIFVVANIPGGSIQIAGTAFSTYLISRVIFELISSRYLLHSSETKKIVITIIGLMVISISYIGFAFFQTLAALFIFNSLAGIGLGIASPAKNSLFSTHLDKNREPAEWGMYDAIIFICMALATALGGFIANQYGFQPLFLLSALINTIGIIPYLLYIRS